MGLDFSRDEAAGNDSLGVPVDQDEIEHFRLWEHFHGAGRDLAAKSLVGAEKKLLARLPARVKRPGNLGAAE